MEKRGAKSFANISKRYLRTYLNFNPGFGAIWGIKGYDYKPFNYSRQAIAKESAEYEKIYKILRRVDTSQLNKDETLDYKVLKAQLETDLYDINHSDKRAIMSPSDFLPFDDIQILIERDIQKLSDKVLFRLKDMQHSLRQAIERLKEEASFQPPEWVKSSIQQSEDGIVFLHDLLKNKKIQRSKLYKKIKKEVKLAQEATEEYKDFLENDLLKKASGSFAVGEERFKLALQNNQFIDLEPEEIYEFGKNLFHKTKKEINAMLKGTTYNLNSYLQMIRRHLPPKDNLLNIYQKYMEQSINFFTEKHIVPLEHDEEMYVIKVPAYAAREYPYAAYSFPPLYGKQVGYTLINTYFKENLIEQTYPFIRLTAVHEGYPGHHLQISLANLLARKRPSGFIRVLNEASSMYEGWAMYCEQLMLDQGFLTNRNDKFTHFKDRLWRALRVMIDVGFHTKQWSYDKAKDLMVKELKFSPESAESDLDWYIEQPGVPLGYALGWKMINLLRDYEKDRLGKKFSLYDFHKKLLSQGSIGLPLVIERAFGKKALKQVYREFKREL